MRWFSGRGQHPPACPRSGSPTRRTARLPRGWCHREAERQVVGHEHQRPSTDDRVIEVLAWIGVEPRRRWRWISQSGVQSQEGTANALTVDGAVLAEARNVKEAKNGELCEGGRFQIVVVGVETGRRWILEALSFVEQLAGSRACTRSPVCIAVLHVLGLAGSGSVSDVVRFLQPHIRQVLCVFRTSTGSNRRDFKSWLPACCCAVLSCFVCAVGGCSLTFLSGFFFDCCWLSCRVTQLVRCYGLWPGCLLLIRAGVPSLLIFRGLSAAFLWLRLTMLGLLGLFEDVLFAWAVLSSGAESALADACCFAGGPVPDIWSGWEIHMNRGSSIAPLLDLRRRLQVVLDVFGK